MYLWEVVVLVGCGARLLLVCRLLLRRLPLLLRPEQRHAAAHVGILLQLLLHMPFEAMSVHQWIGPWICESRALTQMGCRGALRQGQGQNAHAPSVTLRQPSTCSLHGFMTKFQDSPNMAVNGALQQACAWQSATGAGLQCGRTCRKASMSTVSRSAALRAAAPVFSADSTPCSVRTIARGHRPAHDAAAKCKTTQSTSCCAQK